MHLLRLALLAVVLCGVVHEIRATTCTAATRKTCQATLFVKNTCGTSGDCECVSGKVPIKTGCGVPVQAPAVDAGEYSGEVFKGEDFTLTCSTVGAPGSYKWYEDDAEVNGETKKTFKVPTTTPGAKTYKCLATTAGTDSDKSKEFKVTIYEGKGTITKQPVVTGLPQKAMKDAKFTAKCTNIPKDPKGISYEWNDALVTKDGDLQVTAKENPTKAEEGKDVTCTLKDKTSGDRTLPTGGASTSLPQSITVATVTGVEFQAPVNLKTVRKGSAVTLRCQLKEQDVEGVKTTWTWKKDSADLTSGVDSKDKFSDLTYTFSEAVSTSITFKCSVTVGTSTSAMEASKTVTVAESLKTLVKAEPPQPIIGGYMAVKCLVFAASKAALTYSWTVKGVTVPGQIDHTLQVNELTAADDAGDYQCAVRINNLEQSPLSTAKTLTVAQAAPIVTSSSTSYGEGSSYTLTCTSKSESPGLTYKWFKGSKEEKGKTGKELTVVATATEAKYKCQTTFSSNPAKESNELSIKGEKFESVQVDGIISPVIGTKASYTCNAATGSGVSDTVAYKWKKGSAYIPGATAATYTYDVKDATPLKLTCEGTVGGVSKASSEITVTGVSKPAKPSVTSPDTTGLTPDFYLSKGEKHSFQCNSESATSDAKYEWKKGTTKLVGESDTYTIAKAMATDEGKYTCSITVNAQKSDASKEVEFKVEDKKGKRCTLTGFGTECIGEYYSGNCIGERCECSATGARNAFGCISKSSVTTKPTTDNGATTDKDGDGVAGIAASVFLVFVAALTTLFL